jgi:hypothetical protein
MKNAFVIASVSALVAGVGGAAAAQAIGTGSAARPMLRIVDTDPLTVRGVNFRGGEQVTVTAAVQNRVTAKTERHSRLTRTAAGGGFTVALPNVEPPTCAPWSVTAVGASGDRATIKFVPMCGPLP